MIASLRELFRYRELLWMWTLREIRIRYKQSILGVAWAILQPLALMAIFTLVFSLLARVPTDGIPYPVFSYAALVPWTFFSNAVSFAVPSLLSNLNLVTKIYFPKEILPIGSLMAAFIDSLIASALLVGFLIVYRLPVGPTLLWVPLLLCLQLILAIGVALPASALAVWYRDIRFVVPLALQMWMYATPIVYPLSLVPERWRAVYMVNPVAGLIHSYRQVILCGQDPEARYLATSAAIAILLLIVGYAYFKRSEILFSEVI
jgi:lipopolysaccharide transport system permease protein